jgi:hypothetical protein
MSKKVKDDKNRWRNKTVAFRMSPEEAQELDDRWRLLGYRNKQEYLVNAVLKNEVRAVGNAQMLYQFRGDLKKIEQELSRISKASEIDEELLTPIRTMLQIMEAFRPAAKKKYQAEMPDEQYHKMKHLQMLRQMMREEENKDEQNHSSSESEGRSRQDDIRGESGSRSGQ